jgi:hypothetical protein
LSRQTNTHFPDKVNHFIGKLGNVSFGGRMKRLAMTG